MVLLLDRLLRRNKAPEHTFEIFHGGNSSALNILIFTEFINATYFISFDIPLKLLHAEGKINFAVVSQKYVSSIQDNCLDKWASIFRPDVVIMTRYGEGFGREVLKHFRQRGLPVIYHIDDDLLDIPNSLGTEILKRQGANEVIETRQYLLHNCDLIYTSTRHLAELMQQRFPGQGVFHGIYAPYMGALFEASKPQHRAKPVIGYMGSKGHQHDLDLVVPALEHLLAERKDLEFEVFGTIRLPAALERFGPRVRSRSVQKSYTNFLATLATLGWDIGLAPLVDAPFNRCKAPTKFIEYTACGIFVVASKISVYEEAIPEGGGMLVSQDWYGQITKHLDNPEQRLSAIFTSQQHCASKYSPEVLKQQLLDIFGSVRNRVSRNNR